MSTTAALKTFLNRLLLRSRLTSAEAELILRLPGHVVQARANDEIVGLGELTDHACLVALGVVARFDQVADGARQITALHLPGDMADLHSVVVPKTSWALQALVPSTIVRVPHDALIDLAERHPTIARAFWRDCVVDAAIIAQWNLVLGRLRAISRMAHIVCELACRYEHSNSPVARAVTLPMSQAHLGDALGLTPIHVNRMLRQLRERGLIDTDGREVRILDWSGLTAIGEFDPAYLHINDPSGVRA